MRRVRYREIADELVAELDAGLLRAGDLLPSEAELGERFSVSRATTRKALDILRAAGRVESRQGLGWIVAGPPLAQPLQVLDTIESQLVRAGRPAERRVLEFGFGPADDDLSAELEAGEVLRVRRVDLDDGRPFVRVDVRVPADLATEISRAAVERTSLTELLPVPLGGAVQRIGAAVASEEDAELLGVPAGSALLRAERRTSDVDGRVVLTSEHVFPAHLTVFEVELPHVGAAATPRLRLVDEI